MTDENSNEFITEKIKEKPANKKKTVGKVLFTICMGAVFGITAALVFAFSYPKLLVAYGNNGSSYPVTTVEDTEDTENGTENTEYGETEVEDSETIETETTEDQVDTETEASTEVAEEETETLTEAEISKIRLKEYQELQNDIYDLGKAASPALVSVTATVSNTDWYDDSYESQKKYSGLILSMDAEKLKILTGYWGIKYAEQITVTFCDTSTAPAEMKNFDANTGIAVVEVKIADMNGATPGRIASAIMTSRDNTKQGDVIVAVGNPLGTSQSIAIGNVIDADNEVHTIDQVYSVFTTDITGNEESSGVILNLDGEVIGFVIQDFSVGEGNVVTAVPVGELSDVLDILMSERQVAYSGVHIRTVTDAMAKEYDLPKGVYVNEVEMDSPAMEAGIQVADVITEANGKFIREASEYTQVIHSLNIDDTYTVKVMRQSGDGYIELEFELVATYLK
ncbi:MAG: S1C family serine protease [Lachnospiraceae bacterium]|nr:S1C family serine protease [Lachnospiraceae bacterium]